MKLAEALILRADLKTRGQQLLQRLSNNAQVQEGEQPAQNPLDILSEYDQLVAQMLGLIQAINKTNIQTEFEPGKTLTDALAERDVLKARVATYQYLVDAATVKIDRYSRSEIKNLPTIDVAQVQKQADDLAKQLRDLDTKIQGLNWTTDLVE